MAGREANKRLAAQRKLAAQRAMAAASGRRAARRKQLLMVAVPVVAVLVIVGILVAIKVNTGSGGPKSGQAATLATPRLVSQVTNVPAATLNAVGAGTVKAVPSPITGAALTADGKPRMLYVGAEYCPYCATERWAVVAALSRFGTFSNLGQTASSPSDVYPNTATLTFHGASYTSNYLSFTGVEQQSNQVVDGNYAPLDKLSAADEAIVAAHSTGGIPFMDIGGKYVVNGASYDPGVLAGKTHAQIASALSNPNSPVAKGVDGTANVLTAALCTLTKQQPSAVCTSPGVRAGAAKLGAG